MYFYPRNRYLHVKTEKEQKEEGFKGLLIPDDYKGNSSPIATVRLLKACEGSSYNQDEGNLLLVPSHIVETVRYGEEEIEIVPENAVYGVMVKV